MYESSNKYMMIGIVVSLMLLFTLGFSVKSYTPTKFKRKKYKTVHMKVLKKKKEVKKIEIKKEEIKKEIIKEVKKEEIKKKKKKPKKVKKKKKIVKKVPPKDPINKKKEVKKEDKKEVKKEEVKNVPVFGVTMNSTTSGNSGFKVQMGNTLMTDDTTGWENGKPKKVGEYNPDDFIAEKDVKKVVKKKRAKIVKKAVPKKVVRPKYTSIAKDEEIEGKIILKISIDKNGNVTSAKVLKGLGYGLDEVAIKAVKKFKFSPAILDNGKTTKSTITYTINFRLDD